MTFLTLMDKLGAGHTFGLYAALCGLCLIYCYFKVPETKGVALEDIEKHLNQPKSLRELGLPS